MTTDKIRDEKLQYDSNREATKMPTLSSGKIDKYEYLRGEEILFSNQRQIKEQGKFTYCPFGKTSEKQIKTIEHQWEKQIKAIEDHRKQLLKSSSEKESWALLKQKEIFEKLANERIQINCNKLIYHFKGECGPKYFIGFKDPVAFIKK